MSQWNFSNDWISNSFNFQDFDYHTNRMNPMRRVLLEYNFFMILITDYFIFEVLNSSKKKKVLNSMGSTSETTTSLSGCQPVMCFGLVFSTINLIFYFTFLTYIFCPNLCILHSFCNFICKFSYISSQTDLFKINYILKNNIYN